MTLRHTTLGRTPLDEWSVRRSDHLPDNTQHPQQRDIHIPGGIRSRNHIIRGPQTQPLDRDATGIGMTCNGH